MRVLISAGWLGGAGGAERALHSVLRALSQDDVDVVVRQHLGGHLADIGPRIRVHSMTGWRFRGAAMRAGVKGRAVQDLLNPVRRRVAARYDVYLQFHAGPNVGAAVDADVRLLIPSGNYVDPERAHGFDFVALQAPDNAALVADGIPTVLLPPPLFDLSETAQPLTMALPETFFLTVFNPYGAIKGTDDLARVVDDAPYPIVWCHSQATVAFEIPDVLVDHPNLVHVVDATPSQLRYLYEHCHAYLSFSKSEGFGWSTADALRYSDNVVSRPVGVLSYSYQLESVVAIGSDWDVNWAALPNHGERVRRDLGWVSPEKFRLRLGESCRLNQHKQTGWVRRGGLASLKIDSKETSSPLPPSEFRQTHW